MKSGSTGSVDTTREEAARRERRATSPEERSPAALARIIEEDIIPRLLLAHQLGPPLQPETCETAFGVQHFDIDRFCHVVMHGNLASVLQHANWLAKRGAPLETIFLHLLAPTARRLGELWEADACSFSDVTIGLSRLQQAVHELAGGSGGRARAAADGAAPRALFVPAPL